MANKVYVILLVVCLTQVAIAAKPEESIKIEDVIAKAQLAVTNMGAEVQKILGIKEIPDAEQVANTLVTQSKALATKVGGIVSELQQEISSHPDIGSAAAAVAKKLNETVQQLQQQAPDMQAKAVDIQKRLQTGLETLVTESQNLANAVSSELGPVREDFAKISQNTLKQVIDTANSVQEKIKSALATNNAQV